MYSLREGIKTATKDRILLCVANVAQAYGPGKNNKFGCCGTETFFQDGEVGVRLDGAEDAPKILRPLERCKIEF